MNEHAYSLGIQSTKDILSYDDSESATITATLTDNSSAVSGKTLSYVIKHGSTIISTGSDTTDSNGQISFNYASTGVGAVTIVFSYGSLLQEAYELIDAVYYNPNSITSNTPFNNILLPSDFELSFKVKRPSNSGNTSYVQLNNDSRIVSLIGQVGGAGNNQIRCYSSSNNFHDYAISNTPLNSEVELKVVKNGSNFTYSMGESSTSMTCSQTFAKLQSASVSGGNYIKELLIKAL